MGSRGEGIGGALKALLKLGKLLQQIRITAGVGARRLRGLRRAQVRVACFRLFGLRQTRLFRRCGHYLELSDCTAREGGTQLAEVNADSRDAKTWLSLCQRKTQGSGHGRAKACILKCPETFE